MLKRYSLIIFLLILAVCSLPFMSYANPHPFYKPHGQVQGQSIVNENNYQETAASAYAPTVIATSDCLGSFSAGGQGQFFGFSLGGATQSKPCNIREFAKMFINDPTVYKAILCQDKMVRKAIESTGGGCPDYKTSYNPPFLAYKPKRCEYPNQKGCAESKHLR